ncbi:MAG: hypothetical protein GIW97_04150 [Candidatus Eremiobacteraeota bacterium]|nr:hypothetical protein [Candidatus Eremiobacteraeota bacterium]
MKKAATAKKTTSKKNTAKKKPAKTTVKRTVKKAAENVESSAERMRGLGAAVVRAGVLMQQGAAVMDSMAERAAKKRGRK